MPSSNKRKLLHVWRMKKNPSRFNYIQLVDMTNILSDVIAQIIDQCVKAHRRDRSGRIMTLEHLELNPYFVAEEKTWKFNEVQDGNQC